MKKVLATLLATTLLAVSMTGCGGSSSQDTNNNGGSGEPAANIDADTSVELTMWCIATESDSNRKAYEQAIDDLKTAYPNITLNWKENVTENEAYKTKIKSAVAADDMPDIFFTWSCAFLGDFVDAGRVYCMDSTYAKYANELPEVMMGNVKYNGSYYGVPMTMNIVGMFCNMELLAKVGYNDVPATYDELIDCCDKLLAEGIIPFGCAGKETWCVTEYLESIIEKTAGATALNEIFAGNASWDNEDVAKGVKIFQEMIDKGYFDPAGVALSNDEVKNNFMAGKYAFYMNGTWNCADFCNAGLQDTVKVSEFPVIDSSKSQLGELIGGPSDTLAVAAGSKNAAIAADYTFQLARGICKYCYLDGAGLPAWTPDYDTSSINPLTSAVSEICANAKQYVLFGDTAMDANTADIYLRYVAQIYTSEISGDDFVAGLTKDIK